MRRIAGAERPDWRERAAAAGFGFHTLDGEAYWDESAYWAFSLDEIETDIEAATADLHALCRELVDRVVGDERLLTRLAIPPIAWDAVAESWRRGDASLYGRFDLAYDGTGPAKLLEYNADTPTALYETGYFQWSWLEDLLASGDLPPGTDQFNSVHDRLVATLARLGGGSLLHLTCLSDAPEDRGTVAYVEDCALQAGLRTRFVDIGEIALRDDGSFADGRGAIRLLFKLYPWEWMFADAYAGAIAGSGCRFLEPPWKAVLSNKGILPLLWEMAPNHPNLLPSYFESDPRKASLGPSFARKPLYSREGANVLLVRDAAVLQRDEGPYGGEGFVRQGLARLAHGSGGFAVIGSWLVGEEPAGLCIRESEGPITTNRSRFLPHAIEA
ncbi:glutathionylspermidine synthase family protein [Salinarimonas soli]|uniref:Glutathionylspermidine synthase family protein n=1 Tax=Salinarimonas soli TaxID=1638099 RepID=A0A5B2W034_9HYPH|nr:glutathionylspermidine synthase family protein [Salinarimonas soli]KAA2243942.1 glutathionylspermidine synthase family protein [Salinarimonas soli]